MPLARSFLLPFKSSPQRFLTRTVNTRAMAAVNPTSKNKDANYKFGWEISVRSTAIRERDKTLIREYVGNRAGESQT